MVYSVEILFDVEVYHPLVSFIKIFECFLYSLLTVSVRPESVAVVREVLVVAE